MIVDRCLVTAPYVGLIDSAAGRYLCRLDSPPGNRQIVKATSRYRELIQTFALGADPQQIVDGATDREETARQIDVLLDAQLLLAMPPTSVRAPSLELEVTNRCNAACVMCPRDNLRPIGDMDERTFAAVLRLCRTIPTSGVSLQGIGEPTLHRNLKSWMAELRAALPTQPIMMVSNGFKLRPEDVAELRQAGLSHLQWSFHSLDPDLYNAIMGVHQYDRVRRNLEDVLAAHADFLSVNMVLLDSNRTEVEQVQAWLMEHGLSPGRLRVIPAFSRGGHLDVSALLRRDRSATIGRCVYVRKTIFIAWNGDVLPCSSDIAGDHVYANLNDTTTDVMLARWRDDLLARPIDFEICRSCDHHTRGTFETSWFTSIRGLPLASQ